MNNFHQLYICHNFELPLAIYLVVCWFLSSKVLLFSNLTSFLWTFLSDFFKKKENALSLRELYWERKWRNSLNARSREYGGWSRTDKSKSNIFRPGWNTTFILLMSRRRFRGRFFPAWFLLNEKQNVSVTSKTFILFMSMRCFRKRFSCSLSYPFRVATGCGLGCVKAKG